MSQADGWMDGWLGRGIACKPPTGHAELDCSVEGERWRGGVVIERMSEARPLLSGTNAF